MMHSCLQLSLRREDKAQTTRLGIFCAMPYLLQDAKGTLSRDVKRVGTHTQSRTSFAQGGVDGFGRVAPMARPGALPIP